MQSFWEKKKKVNYGQTGGETEKKYKAFPLIVRGKWEREEKPINKSMQAGQWEGDCHVLQQKDDFRVVQWNGETNPEY